MQLRSSLFVGTLLCFGAAACGDDPPNDELICPAGTVRAGGECVAPTTDGGQPDASNNDGSLDGGPTDSGSEDATVPDGGEGQAAISSTAIDFGRTVVGTEWTETVDITNRSSMPVRIGIGILSGAQASDYSVIASSTVGPNGVDLAPGQGLTLTYRFDPRAVGARGAAMIVSLCEGGCETPITLSGEGVLDAITCAPTLHDFGLVNPGACDSTPVSCSNVSGHPATIERLGFSGGSSPSFSVTSSAVPLLVAAAALQTFDVRYCPTAVGAETATFEINVAHPDVAHRTLSVALSGVGGGPNIVCTPESLDFGVLGIGQDRTLSVSCTNDGEGTIAISSVSIAGAGEFTTLGGATTLDPGMTESFDVIFAPTVAGPATDSLIIASDDRDTPQWSVSLVAEALAPNGCSLTITPATIDFGAVRTGQRGHGSAVISNTGSGVCGATVVGLAAGSAAAFSLPTTPSVQLAPGASTVIEADFAPTAVGARQGGVQLSTTDLANSAATIALSGEGVGAGYALSANPTAVDFGVIAPACAAAATRNVAIQNLGTTTLQITVSTGGAFSVDGGPSASFTLGAGLSRAVEVGFLPPATGPYSGRLEVAATGLSSLFVALTGASTTIPSNVETFGGGGVAQVIDLLLIVDDSGSMAEEQARLAAAAPTLIARADAAGVDYHIAVTTTDPGIDVFSPFPGGTLRGTPAFVTSISPTREADLMAAINQGVNGSGDERGLYTMTEAVTNGTLLSGSNQGFLRANGELAVLVISDEEDSSPNPVAGYVAALRARPIGLPDSVRIFGITPTPAGCTGAGFPVPPELRYSEAATLTGGFVRAICDPDYTPTLTELADAIFLGSHATYQLGSRPAPGSVEVRIDGVLTPSASGAVWGVDYLRAQVAFAPGQAPASGALIEIRYDSVCTPASCGNGSVQSGEQCDDGNASNTDTCIDSCYLASCGDGHSQGVEQCDDGNTIAGDGCSAGCVVEGCGNGILEPGEDCDNGPGNSDTAANACRTDCRDPRCSDGVVDSGETCDDGNLDSTDNCTASCAIASCGDGFVHFGVEQCDDGNTVNTDLCTNACVFNLPSLTVTSAAAVLTPTPGGNAMALGDENETQVPIGFAFSFFGTPVTMIDVGSNGVIAFDQPTLSFPFQNEAIPSTLDPNGIIAWWWDDLDFSRTALSPSATEQIVGVAPNRIHVLTFQNVPRYDPSNVANTLVNAEIRIFETSNRITVHYGVVSGTGTTFNATAGWEEPQGLAGQDILGCGANCAAANWPTNTRYTYAP